VVRKLLEKIKNLFKRRKDMSPEQLRDRVLSDLGDAGEVVTTLYGHAHQTPPDFSDLVTNHLEVLVEIAKMLQAERHNR
jgi:hypothetical protein